MAQRSVVPLHPSVRATGWVSLFTDASSEMIYPLLPAFLLSTLQASIGFVGVIEGLAETTAALLKLYSGSFSDRVGARRPFVLVGYGLSSVARPIMAMAAAPWHVLVVRICDRIGKGLRGAPRDALIADVTAAEDRGHAFGYQRAMDHTGAMIGPLIAFGLLELAHWDLRRIFWLAALPGVAAMIAAAFVRDKPELKPSTPSGAAPVSLAAWRQLDPLLLRAIGVIGLFTLGNSSDAFLIVRAQEAGIGLPWVPLLWVALHLVKSVTSVPGGKLSDRIDRRRVIIGGWIVYALVYLGFGLAHAAWQMWVLFALYGIYFGLTEGTEKALVADLAGPERKGTAFGLYTFVVGVAALPASVLMGVVYHWAGALAAFGMGAALALLASIAMLLAMPARPS